MELMETNMFDLNYKFSKCKKILNSIDVEKPADTVAKQLEVAAKYIKRLETICLNKYNSWDEAPSKYHQTYLDIQLQLYGLKLVNHSKLIVI